MARAGKRNTFKVADLFSGAGGASYGFRAHDRFQVVFAADRQVGKPCNGVGTLECNRTYAENMGLQPKEVDLAEYEPREMLRDAGLKPGELDVLISCAPCTGFSRTLRKNHLEDDPRNLLVERTGLFVEVLRPKLLVMENARELIRGNFAYHSDELRQHLQAIGYSFLGEVHMLTDFGLPQSRERAIIVARSDGHPVKSMHDLWQGYTVRPEALTVRRAIGNLPAVAAGEAHPRDPMHVSPRFGRDTTWRRLKAIPHNGGSWADLIGRPDADELLIPSMRRAIARGDFGSHPDVYGRMSWDKPAVTIKRECAHVGNGRYAHPEQDRMFTVREMAILQGFPREYRFIAGAASNMYRHIGDAVPPLISYQLAQLCCWMLTGRKPKIKECVLPGTSLIAADIRKGAPEPLFETAADEHLAGTGLRAKA